MIAPEQLTAALERLDSRDWEVLDLSLRRRVPDEAMAQIFECEPAEVARRRASAIENLADDLGVQRGEDLGSVLKALLDPGTWDAADAHHPGFQAFEHPPGESGGEGQADDAHDDGPPERIEPPELRTSEAARLFRVPPSDEPAGPVIEPATVPVAQQDEASDYDEEAEPGEEAEEEEDAGQAPGPVPLVAPTNGHTATDREPVLDMLAERDQERRRKRMRTPLAWVVGGTLGAALLFGAGLVGATIFGDPDGDSGSSDGPSTPRRFVPDRSGPLAAPFPSDPRTGVCYTTATVRKPVRVYQRPGSRRSLKLKARTEWNSPRIFSVVRQRNGWLAVLAPELKNGEVGWMRAGSAKLDCVRWSLHADLSRRRLYVRKDGHTVHKYRIAIGTRNNPTPRGRFAVTDKLKVTDKGSPYGCCVLALTGHQTKLPQDWPGGDRLAVHATSDLSSIGKRSSLGCMRLKPKQASWLITNVPLGTPIFIRT
jgi:L,D-transpeptidase catalytic domain